MVPGLKSVISDGVMTIDITLQNHISKASQLLGKKFPLNLKL
jgi:hypothetical protein